jgi:hypothetical protein
MRHVYATALTRTTWQAGGSYRLPFGAVAADPLMPLLELPGVAERVGAARAAVDALLGNRTLRRRSPDVSAESSLRGAWASAWLAGAEWPLADVRSGAAATDPVVQGALRVHSALPGLVSTWSRAPRQALARVHALAAGDLVQDHNLLGRPRPAEEVLARLDTLTDVLTATSAPAVVVAAVVHGELLGLDAFPPVSGVVARTAARLCIVERGLDPRSLVVLEAGHRELAPDYRTALAVYRTGAPGGLGYWVRHCADATEAGAREAAAICAAIARG